MELLGKRWTILIIHQLLEGTKRFNEIESALPISGRLLSERLKELEKEGIVERKVHAESAVRIEYTLTEKGQSLMNTIQEIEKWSQTWL